MKILVLQIKIRVSYVHSLKEKRMVLSSIKGRLKNKFNISVGEISYQDNHKIIGIGISKVCISKDIAYSTKEKILDFVEDNCDGEIIEIVEEIIEI